MRYEDVPREFNIASHFLDRNDPGRTALITPEGTATYGELSARANRIGHALRALGVGRGDRVLIALADGVDFVATWYGVQKIGAITAEVYTYLQPKDYRYYADYAEPRIVVADAVTLERLRVAGVGNLLVSGVPADLLRPGEHHFESLVAAQPAELEPAPTRSDDVAIWKFTTGSTGAPKACVLPARSPLLACEWYARGVLDMGPDDVVLPVPKLFFGYSRDMTALYPFGSGGAGIAFPERSTAERIFELIAAHRPTILVNVPTMMSAMVSHPEAAAQDLSSLRLCTSAGEALPADLHRRWMDTFGVEVLDVIGSSEVYHAYISNRPGRTRQGSLGEVVPGYRARVIDADGETLPDGEVGRLEIVGETAALEYWRAPEKSAETFPAPHTVRSGDLFTRDADGYYYYKGRADDLLKVSGVWVAPSEIENCLRSHPAVAEAAVVGYEVDGLTLPRAFVVASGEVSAAELQAFVKTTLAPHKYPRDVRFVDRLPETANGKLDRRALKEVG
ncbi:benzoate--CoA ligase [Sphaerisporangium siamense]|uniref:Benzoate-CoA ligase family protein n=1 Tax=Sphaerisporangium siamense TaxID=795645 RepID=A0A7W7D8Y6_9ACTN|nr:benzoate-CoA ligase family protein [Sphaerisporangium siamense]MBB4702437.1 benzoate-CoA ligase family protein [Sphaerisporangium siamense]GII88132.1 benzoate--CoA ligase [Sphaerisporangium siamense]